MYFPISSHSTHSSLQLFPYVAHITKLNSLTPHNKPVVNTYTPCHFGISVKEHNHMRVK